ncbi:hypothetical protein BV22DRAFT_1115338 [Leucogyrophana mollusca]|uniref:Uncharacterized protein n=1 Tax=Leucogyrophana mollusca TaxID=85980 RepID=A0ACB8B175_9AGAM|nr:hypothetical protein BV22DRAFT_1115338 [Leucogyrophana mollusca]
MNSTFVYSSIRGLRYIVITVGGNTTTNASLVFQPQRVTANLGDTVIFNFTLGSHTATQSTFAAPCVLAHDSDPTINGFDSLLRLAGNGSNASILSVPMLEQNYQQTMWFFDWSTCGEGGVGVINDNESSTETLAGFERNAIRLNGTTSTTSSTPSQTSTSPTSQGTPGSGSSDADRSVRVGSMIVLPLLVLGIAL